MVTKRIILGDIEETLLLCGEQDSNLKALEKKFGVQIFARSSALSIRGNARRVDQALSSLEDMRNKIKADRSMNSGRSLSAAGQDYQTLAKERHFGPEIPGGKGVQEDVIFTCASGKLIRAQSPHQKKFVEAIAKQDMVMAVGPAGTGKTFLAVVCALKALYSGRVGRIVLSRPVVEAGEKLGFLPGDFYEKVNPYLKPLYDAFHILIGSEKFRIFREDETIEIVPLAYMRGRTLEHAFVILDEAQNTTPEQMKMFLTRMGANSKMVITGDVTQIDLEFKKQSGFIHVLKILKHIPEIHFIEFTEEDVIRHSLVRQILKAYQTHEVKERGEKDIIE